MRRGRDGDGAGDGSWYLRHRGKLTEVRLDILLLVMRIRGQGQLVTPLRAENTVNGECQRLGGQGRGVRAQGKQGEARHRQEWPEEEGVGQGQGAG